MLQDCLMHYVTQNVAVVEYSDQPIALMMTGRGTTPIIITNPAQPLAATSTSITIGVGDITANT